MYGPCGFLELSGSVPVCISIVIDSIYHSLKNVDYVLAIFGLVKFEGNVPSYCSPTPSTSSFLFDRYFTLFVLSNHSASQNHIFSKSRYQELRINEADILLFAITRYPQPQSADRCPHPLSNTSGSGRCIDHAGERVHLAS